MKPIYEYSSIPYRSNIFSAQYAVNLDYFGHPLIQDGQGSPVLGSLYAITARK